MNGNINFDALEQELRKEAVLARRREYETRKPCFYLEPHYAPATAVKPKAVYKENSGKRIINMI